MMLISVIVPVYNTGDLLRDCLDSLVGQTLDKIEIIVIDDCSTDNSLEIIKQYADRYPNIRVYQNQVNIGQGATRNVGLKYAKGDYIGFLDSDDYVSLTMFENLYQNIIANNYPDYVMTGLIFVKDNTYLKNNIGTIDKTGRLIKTTERELKLLDISPSVCNKLFKKSLIGQYRFLEHCKWEDIAFSDVLYMRATSVLEQTTPDYFYRRNLSSGVSAINYSPNEDIYEIFIVTDEIMREARNHPQYYDSALINCFAAIFQRIEELEHWNIEEEAKLLIKRRIFDTTYQKYGSLLNVDCDLLSARAYFKIIDEYKKYCQEEKGEGSKKR